MVAKSLALRDCGDWPGEHLRLSDLVADDGKKKKLRRNSVARLESAATIWSTFPSADHRSAGALRSPPSVQIWMCRRVYLPRWRSCQNAGPRVRQAHTNLARRRSHE